MSRSEGERALRLVRRLGVALLTGLYVIVGCLGVLITPLSSLLIIGPLLAAAGAAGYCCALLARVGSPPARHRLAAAGALAAVLLPFLSGAQMLGAVGGALVLTASLLAVLVLGLWLLAIPSPAGARHLLAPGPADDAELREVLRQAPLQMLFRRWHATSDTLRSQPSGHTQAAAVYLRERLLDELHDRDPVGAQRWIDHGDGRRPERHIRSDQDLTG